MIYLIFINYKKYNPKKSPKEVIKKCAGSEKFCDDLTPKIEKYYYEEKLTHINIEDPIIKSNKLIPTLIGIIAGINFSMVVVLFKIRFFPELEFTEHPEIRYTGLTITFTIMHIVKSYLMEDEKYSEKQIILITIVLFIFIICISIIIILE